MHSNRQVATATLRCAQDTTERLPLPHTSLNMFSSSVLLYLTLLLHVASLVGAIAPGSDLLSPLPGISASSISSHSNRSSTLSLNADATTALLKFTLVTDQAAWSVRSVFLLELYNRGITFEDVGTGNPRTLNPPLLIVAGGSGAGNDVFAATTRQPGVFYFISGQTFNGQLAASSDTSFEPRNAAATTIDKKSNRLYRIGGLVRNQQVETYAAESWTSTDAIVWTDSSATSNSPLDYDRFYAGSTVDSAGRLFVVGGTINGFRSYRSDVWMSNSAARDWTLQTDSAEFGTRGIGVLLNTPLPSGGDALLYIGGQNEKDNNNEVYVSTNLGKNWLLLNARAPFAQRDAFTGRITKDGLIIIAGGLADRDVGLNELNINDVWVSPNGGWSWSLCVDDAEWEDRYLQQSVLDENGYFYVVGGRTTKNGILTNYNDMWRSSISFHDLNAVSKTCSGMKIPSCGIGLKCLPSAGTVVSADGSFVSCAACPDPSLGSSNDGFSSSVFYFVLFLFLLTFVLLCYALYNVRNAGGKAPIPLLCLSSWWALDNGQQSSATESAFETTLSSADSSSSEFRAFPDKSSI